MPRISNVYELIEIYTNVGLNRQTIDAIMDYIDVCTQKERCDDVNSVLEVSDRICTEYGTGGCTPAMLAASMLAHGVTETSFAARYLSIRAGLSEFFEPATDIGNGFAIMIIMVTREPKVKEMIDNLVSEYRRFSMRSVVTANAIAALHTSEHYDLPLAVSIFASMFVLSTLYRYNIIDLLKMSGYLGVHREFTGSLNREALYGG